MVNDEHFFPLTDWFDVPLIWLGQTCWNKRFLSRCFKFPIDFYWLWNRLSWCWIFWRVLTPGGGLCLAFVWFQSESVSFLRYLFVCVVGMLLDQVMIDLAALEQRWDNDVTIDRWNAWERLGTLGNAWERYCWPNDAPICYPDSNWLIFEEEKRKRKCRWFIFPFHLIFHRKLGRENKCHCSLPPLSFSLSLSLSLSLSFFLCSCYFCFESKCEGLMRWSILGWFTCEEINVEISWLEPGIDLWRGEEQWHPITSRHVIFNLWLTRVCTNKRCLNGTGADSYVTGVGFRADVTPRELLAPVGV